MHKCSGSRNVPRCLHACHTDARDTPRTCSERPPAGPQTMPSSRLSAASSFSVRPLRMRTCAVLDNNYNVLWVSLLLLLATTMRGHARTHATNWEQEYFRLVRNKPLVTTCSSTLTRGPLSFSHSSPHDTLWRHFQAHRACPPAYRAVEQGRTWGIREDFFFFEGI